LPQKIYSSSNNNKNINIYNSLQLMTIFSSACRISMNILATLPFIRTRALGMRNARPAVLMPLLLGVTMSMTTPAIAQVCGPAGSYQTFAAYNGQSPSETIINNNELFLERSVLKIKNELSGNAAINTDRISDTHYPGEPGVNLGHPSGAATSIADSITTTFEFFDPASPGNYLPVTDLSFRLHDIDAGDNIIVNAYDENGDLISLDTPGFYSLYPSSYASYVASNRFTSGNADDAASGTRLGTIDFDFTGKKIQRIEFIYWDTAALGTYTIAEFKACNPPPPQPPGPPAPVPATSWWSLALMGLLIPAVSAARAKRRKNR